MCLNLVDTCTAHVPCTPTHTPTHTHTHTHTQFSSSGNTDDFIREVTESHNVSYNMLTKMNSEDEISSPFSLSSSRHSLLIVESDADHDGSESPDRLDCLQDFKEKESRPSYSIMSCPISHSLPTSEKLTADPERETELVPTSVLITPSDDDEPLPKSSTRRPPPLLTRQSAVLEPDQSDLSRLTPTNLSVSQASYYDNLSSPTTPTPESEVKTGGEPSEGQLLSHTHIHTHTHPYIQRLDKSYTSSHTAPHP